MNMRISNQVMVGNVAVGGGAPVTVQSMLSLPWRDFEGNLKEAIALQEGGCEILRVAMPTKESVELISLLKKQLTIPLVADIHFDYRLALLAVDAGIDKIRINPGNIGSKERVKAVADACKEKGVPIRIGVNSGSIEKTILEKYGSPTPAAMVESAIYHAALLEEFDFHNIVISMKSNNVQDTMEAYRLIAGSHSYPLHLGITHTGSPKNGKIKSAIGIGGLLAEGIGDTFRVSLTAPSIEEVELGNDILTALDLRGGVKIISCPTCGRRTTNVEVLTEEIEAALKGYDSDITVAVMGCVVNGPGEAKEADIGITGGGNGKVAIFLKGKILRTVREEDAVDALVEEVNKLEERKR